MACCSSSDKYGRIRGGLWCVLQRRDLSGALTTADRLHRNATPRERESDPRTNGGGRLQRAALQCVREFSICPERCHAREGPQNAAE